MFLIALYHVKASFSDLTFFAVAILDSSTTIFKIGQFRLANDKYSITPAHEHLPSFMLMRKYLQERFKEHNLKVSCLYPEVYDRPKKQTFPAPL